MTKCKHVRVCQDGYNILGIKRCTDCKTTYDQNWKPITIFSEGEMEVIKKLLGVNDHSIRTVGHHEYKNYNPQLSDQEWEDLLKKLS